MANAAADQTTSIRALLDQLQAAHDRMGAENPNRQLLFTAAQVIVQLSMENVSLTRQLTDQPRIVTV